MPEAEITQHLLPLWVWLFLGFWTLGWLAHVTILARSWWSGRFWWTARPHCSCQDCQEYRNKNPNTVNFTNTTKHEKPQMLEIEEVFFLSLVGLGFWWVWVIWETHTFLTKARENHLEEVKKRNRPAEEVAQEFNDMLVAEGGEEIPDILEKMRAQSRREKGTNAKTH